MRARQQHSSEIQKLTSATVRDQSQQWNTVFNGMNRGFANTVTSMSNSSRTSQQNIARVLDLILADFVRMLERMVASWVAQHLFMQVFGIGSHKATTATIPVVGWSIAPAVAADAYANISALKP